MKRELSIEISSPIISWLVEQTPLRIQFISSILVLPSATRAQMVSIFHSEMARILLVPPDMQVSIPISDTSNIEETIWNVSVMCCSISLRDRYLGKDCLEDRRLKNMPISKRRRKKSKLKIFARTAQKDLRSSCITVEDSPLLRIQTTATSPVYSRAA